MGDSTFVLAADGWVQVTPCGRLRRLLEKRLEVRLGIFHAEARGRRDWTPQERR